MSFESKSFLCEKYDALESLKYKELQYIGNLGLLEKKKIAIVGTRRPNAYSKGIVYQLASTLSEYNIVTVSGTAMGVDIIAHRGAKPQNTVAIVAHGIDIIYPKINAKDIQAIQNEGLVLSAYPDGMMPRAYTFVQRNELIACFCDALVVAEADLKSGSLHTARFALKHGKPIYVLPHRIGESLGTWELVKNKQATVIEGVDEFVALYAQGDAKRKTTDALLEYCQSSPSYDESIKIWGEKIFEYELLGKIAIKNGVVFVL